jgi:hypothetical protein
VEQELRQSEPHVDYGDASQRRLMELAEHKDRLPPQQRGLVEEVLETASAVVGELHHATEELRAARATRLGGGQMSHSRRAIVGRRR